MGAGGVRLDWLGEWQTQSLVDHLPAMKVIPVHQGDCHTAAASPTGTSDPVQVGLIVLRTFPVDDMGDVGDIDSPGGDICCNQNINLAVAESSQCLLTRTLTEVTVHSSRCESPLVEIICDLLCISLRATENDGEPTSLGLEYTRDEFLLVEAVGSPYMLLDRIDR
jgi:hypothetical protein